MSQFSCIPITQIWLSILLAGFRSITFVTKTWKLPFQWWEPALFFFSNEGLKSAQSCKSAQVFRIGQGSGLSLSKCFVPISGRHTKLLVTFLITIFFLSWCTFVVPTMVSKSACKVTSVSEVIVTFLQLILSASTGSFFCSLVGLVSHSLRQGDSHKEINTQWRYFEKIDHLRNSWLLLKNNGLQTGFSCL